MEGMGGNAPPGRKKERNWGVWNEGDRWEYTPRRKKTKELGVRNGGNEREIYIKQKLMNCIRKGT